MRPNGIGGAHFRPPSAQSALAYPRQDATTDQAGPDLLAPSASAGPTPPIHNGWSAAGSNMTARAPGPPAFGAKRLPPRNLANGLDNLSLNGGPAQSAAYYSKAPIGGGEYITPPGRQQQAAAPPPPRQAGVSGQPLAQPRAALPGRGPPAFGKAAAGQPPAGPLPPGPGNTGRPASPASPSKYASIPMPASPSPTTSGRAANPSQQQAAQMPLPPSQGRSLAPPSFSRPQVCWEWELQYIQLPTCVLSVCHDTCHKRVFHACKLHVSSMQATHEHPTSRSTSCPTCRQHW